MTVRDRTLFGWLAIVSGLALINYASRLTAKQQPKDEIYTWGLVITGIVLFSIVLTLVLLLARHDFRGLLALRRPTSWPTAGALAVLAIVGVTLLSAALDPILHAGREQGLTSSNWDPSRAPQFFLNALLIVVFAPIVEELLFRGLGYSVLVPFGRWTAILGVGLAFGLAHGLVYGLPILFAFGASLAYLRDQTGSVYPGILVHASYNALALTLSVLS